MTDLFEILTGDGPVLGLLTALAAATIGTVLVVGAYLKLKRLKNARRAAAVPAAGVAGRTPAAAGRARGIEAYRAAESRRTLATMPRQADLTSEFAEPIEPVAEASLAALEDLLGRLQSAAETLETLAGRRSSGSARPAGIEYLHRTV